MEHYLRDLTLNTAQLLLFVVNDLTVADQKFIDYLEGKAGSGSLIVVHNFKEVTTKEELDEVWKVSLIITNTFAVLLRSHPISKNSGKWPTPSMAAWKTLTFLPTTQ